MKNNYKIVIIDDDELAVDNLAFELKSCLLYTSPSPRDCS